ncbi:hypothetical protein, partial [Salmonella enterica]|uniref:hypothetical protein n=1 Tax=Salmonella enterica TaxID=28901 RepID=UPI003297F1D3
HRENEFQSYSILNVFFLGMTKVTIWQQRFFFAINCFKKTLTLCYITILIKKLSFVFMYRIVVICLLLCLTSTLLPAQNLTGI